MLAIDIETYSSVDLIKCGVYAYAAAPDFDVLLFAYAWDDEPVEVVELASGDTLDEDLLRALTDANEFKTAYNANFERVCLATYFDEPMPAEQWRCSAMHARMLGLPNSLENVGKALGLDATEAKDRAGKALIKYFSVPCKPTKANGGRTRNLPEHDPEKWAQYNAYCAQDVEAERAVRARLMAYPVPAQEQRLWELDQRINDAGVRVDRQLVDQAINIEQEHRRRTHHAATLLTGLDNPQSGPQLKQWLYDTEGLEVKSLDKKALPALLESVTEDTTRQALALKQELSKTSTAKYAAMRQGLTDDYIRGLLLYYGASRTGRWAGRQVQVQNLPQNHIPDLALARELVRDGDGAGVELLYGSIPDTLSQLVRTAFIPSEGCRFIVADFSAIEARVIAWLAREQWRMDVFNTHGKIYEASAARMFKVPVESVTKGSPLRQKGKVAELACGYQGGVGALKAMGALEMGVNEDELQPLIDEWRRANKRIVALWRTVNDAALTACREGKSQVIHHGGRPLLVFNLAKDWFFIRLPSGRRLAYYKPEIRPNRFGDDALTYEGAEQGVWTRQETYGGRLVENVVQAIARDCLAESMLRLDAAGYTIRMHVHDEVVLDVPHGQSSPEAVAAIMGRPVEWAPGLPLKADAFECDFYMKD